MRTTKTPQQKKALSYDRDRRNIYGESSEASRKGIRLRKRLVNQSYRSRIRNLIKDMVTGDFQRPTEQDRLISVEGRINSHQRIDWKKSPDISLRDYITIKQQRRITRTNRRKPGNTNQLKSPNGRHRVDPAGSGPCLHLRAE